MTPNITSWAAVASARDDKQNARGRPLEAGAVSWKHLESPSKGDARTKGLFLKLTQRESKGLEPTVAVTTRNPTVVRFYGCASEVLLRAHGLSCRGSLGDRRGASGGDRSCLEGCVSAGSTGMFPCRTAWVVLRTFAHSPGVGQRLGCRGGVGLFGSGRDGPRVHEPQVVLSARSVYNQHGNGGVCCERTASGHTRDMVERWSVAAGGGGPRSPFW